MAAVNITSFMLSLSSGIIRVPRGFVAEADVAAENPPFEVDYMQSGQNQPRRPPARIQRPDGSAKPGALTKRNLGQAFVCIALRPPLDSGSV